MARGPEARGRDRERLQEEDLGLGVGGGVQLGARELRVRLRLDDLAAKEQRQQRALVAPEQLNVALHLVGDQRAAGRVHLTARRRARLVLLLLEDEREGDSARAVPLGVAVGDLLLEDLDVAFAPHGGGHRLAAPVHALARQVLRRQHRLAHLQIGYVDAHARMHMPHAHTQTHGAR